MTSVSIAEAISPKTLSAKEGEITMKSEMNRRDFLKYRGVKSNDK